MHNQTETQYEVSEVQHLCRSSVNEIKKTLRLAGFKLATHPPYEIKTDSLAIYFSQTQPVDTVLYYLEEFNDYEYSKVHGLPEDVQLFKLMKKENSGSAEICADFIQSIGFTQIDSKTMEITITAQVSKADDTFEANEGFRTWTLDEQVSLRNVNL